MALLGKKISTLAGVTTVAGSRKFLLTDTSINETITYTNLLVELGNDLGSTNILTTKGDLVTHNGSAVIRLGVGSDGQYLTGSTGDLTWTNLPDDVANLLTTNGDLITQSAGVPAVLPIGASDQLLSVSGGALVWSNLLSTRGDILTRNASSIVALPIGTSGQVLSSDGTDVSWVTTSTYSDPLTTNGDILIRSGGVTDRLGVGANGEVLVVTAGIPSWGVAGGGVSKPGVTSDDQVAVWTGDGTIEGNSNFTWDGSLMTIDGHVEYQTGIDTKASTYTLVDGDNGKIIEGNGTFSIKVPASGIATGWTVQLVNIGSGTITIDANGETINSTGAASPLLASQWTGASIYYDGVDFVAIGELT